MSYLAMSAAPFNNDEPNDYKKNNIEKKRITHNNQSKTLKNKQVGTGSNIRSHVNAMISQIHKSTGLNMDDNGGGDDDGDELGSFSPPPLPESAGGQRCMDREPINNSISNNTITGYSAMGTNDIPVSIEGFNNLPSKSAEDYYREHVPYYNKINSAPAHNNDELLEKLNYMIHLLEEQQDEKTGHVTEEIILYSFLGIFIIFIIDSFARAGKYVR
jgi:hypothetical protein